MLTLLLPLSAQATTEPPPLARLEVVSINIWGLAWPLSRHRSTRMENLHTLNLDDYDVVGIQEAWRGALRRIPWQADITRPEAGGDAGLGLIGRRIDAEDVPTLVPFAASAGVERFKDKGILLTTIDIPDGPPVWVYVTHFQAGPDAGGVRSEQAAQLLSLMDERPGPAIVIGDFNLYSNHAIDSGTEAAFAAAGLQDVALKDGTPQPTYIAENPYIWKGEDGERFDRIYVRDGDGVRLVVDDVSVLSYDTPLSDHQPVVASIAVLPDDAQALASP